MSHWKPRLVAAVCASVVATFAPSAVAQDDCPTPGGFAFEDFVLIELSPSIRNLRSGNRVCSVTFSCDEPFGVRIDRSEPRPIPDVAGHDVHDPAGTDPTRPLGELTSTGSSVTYTAPEVSGQVVGIFSCLSLGGANTVTFVTNEARLSSDPPNLFEELRPPGDFMLVGGEVGQNHRLNHFGKPELVRKVRMIAAMYAREYPDAPRLRINDMSLPTGGLFDIDGNWMPNHRTHRKGVEVDVGLVSRVRVLGLQRIAHQVGVSLFIIHNRRAQNGQVLFDEDGNPIPSSYHIQIQ